MTQSPQKLYRAHVYISGRVQGVGYRMTTVQKAKQAGVNGWVKNLADGRVEAVFEGEQEAVQQMVQWCHLGPRSAQVEDVAVSDESPQGLNGFETRF
jgi:acylphosphatase